MKTELPQKLCHVCLAYINKYKFKLCLENLANHMTYKFSLIYFFVPLIISTTAIREIFYI